MEKADKSPESKKPAFTIDPKKSGLVETYTVKAGDTLSKIAKQIYGDEKHYQKIYEANQDLIGPDPDLIKVGQVLKLPPK